MSVTTGYTYQPNSEATVSVGNQNFKLFTDGDTAWARDERTDKSLVEAMRNGSAMVIEGYVESRYHHDRHLQPLRNVVGLRSDQQGLQRQALKMRGGSAPVG